MVPTFSVVIPTKGRPLLLERALRSALGQRGPDVEIIVADDGAGEGEAMAASYGDPRVTAFRTGEAGQAAARNMAIARATGPYIAFLDDDDWWAAPDHLDRLGAALDAGAGLAFADGRIVMEDTGGTEIPFAASIDAEAIRRDNMLLVSGIGFRRERYDAVGPFDESFAVYWDWDFYLRLAAAGTPFAPSGGTGVRISVRSGTASSASQLKVRQAELDRLSAKHGLGPLVLRNHESIAVDQAGVRSDQKV